MSNPAQRRERLIAPQFCPVCGHAFAEAGADPQTGLIPIGARVLDAARQVAYRPASVADVAAGMHVSANVAGNLLRRAHAAGIVHRERETLARGGRRYRYVATALLNAYPQPA